MINYHKLYTFFKWFSSTYNFFVSSYFNLLILWRIRSTYFYFSAALSYFLLAIDFFVSIFLRLESKQDSATLEVWSSLRDTLFKLSTVSRGRSISTVCFIFIMLLLALYPPFLKFCCLLPGRYDFAGWAAVWVRFSFSIFLLAYF